MRHQPVAGPNELYINVQSTLPGFVKIRDPELTTLKRYYIRNIEIFTTTETNYLREECMWEGLRGICTAATTLRSGVESSVYCKMPSHAHVSSASFGGPISSYKEWQENKHKLRVSNFSKFFPPDGSVTDYHQFLSEAGLLMRRDRSYDCPKYGLDLRN
jgi:hypothetical protein